jgi:hypothetical protein
MVREYMVEQTMNLRAARKKKKGEEGSRVPTDLQGHTCNDLLPPAGPHLLVSTTSQYHHQLGTKPSTPRLLGNI